MRELLRLRHYSYRTEQSHVLWAERFGAFCQSRGLDLQDQDSLRSFLSYLAIGRNVASSTQNQAFNALLFYFREVLGKEFGEVRGIRAKKGARLPVVLTEEETRAVLAQAEGIAGLILRLVYGSGLRLSEAVRLRVEVQRLLGHKSLETTVVYLHVIKNLQNIPMSPLDMLTEARPSHIADERNGPLPSGTR